MQYNQCQNSDYINKKKCFITGSIFCKMQICKDFLKFQNKRTDENTTKHNIAFFKKIYI